MLRISDAAGGRAGTVHHACSWNGWSGGGCAPCMQLAWVVGRGLCTMHAAGMDGRAGTLHHACSWRGWSGGSHGQSTSSRTAFGFPGVACEEVCDQMQPGRPNVVEATPHVPVASSSCPARSQPCNTSLYCVSLQCMRACAHAPVGCEAIRMNSCGNVPV